MHIVSSCRIGRSFGHSTIIALYLGVEIISIRFSDGIALNKDVATDVDGRLILVVLQREVCDAMLEVHLVVTKAIVTLNAPVRQRHGEVKLPLVIINQRAIHHLAHHKRTHISPHDLVRGALIGTAKAVLVVHKQRERLVICSCDTCTKLIALNTKIVPSATC